MSWPIQADNSCATDRLLLNYIYFSTTAFFQVAKHERSKNSPFWYVGIMACLKNRKRHLSEQRRPPPASKILIIRKVLLTAFSLKLTSSAQKSGISSIFKQAIIYRLANTIYCGVCVWQNKSLPRSFRPWQAVRIRRFGGGDLLILIFNCFTERK